MKTEAQDLFDRFTRILEKAKTATADVRLDLAEDAERLAIDARRWFDARPMGDAHPVVQAIGERCAMLANSARARI